MNWATATLGAPRPAAIIFHAAGRGCVNAADGPDEEG